MIRLLFLSLNAFLFLAAFNAKAQNLIPNFTEGFIVYEIKSAGNSNIPELFKKTNLTLYIKGNQSKLDLKILDGFAKVQIIENESSENVALIDIPMLAEKTSICLSQCPKIFSGIAVSSKVNKAPTKKAEIEIYKKDKSRFLGRSAYKAIVPIVGSKSKASMYLADKLIINTPKFIDNFLGKLPALPLNAELTILGERVIITANEIRRSKISDKVFEIPKDYQQKTANELRSEIESFCGMSNDGKGI
jgi:hypothetical protein